MRLNQNQMQVFLHCQKIYKTIQVYLNQLFSLLNDRTVLRKQLQTAESIKFNQDFKFAPEPY